MDLAGIYSRHYENNHALTNDHIVSSYQWSLPYGVTGKFRGRVPREERAVVSGEVGVLVQRSGFEAGGLDLVKTLAPIMSHHRGVSADAPTLGRLIISPPAPALLVPAPCFQLSCRPCLCPVLHPSGIVLSPL